MENILISVVIPVYNTPVKRLERCLNSIYANTGVAYEVILVDDGSCEELSRSYYALCNGLKNARFFRRENGGASRARNYGIEQAVGKYVTFIDADDYISHSCFLQAKWIIENMQPDLVIGLIRQCSGDNDHALKEMSQLVSDTQMFSSEEERIQLLGQMLSRKNPILTFPNGYIGAGPCAKMIIREKLQRVNFDETVVWAEDAVWNIQLMRVCQSIILCKEAWYAYSIYEQSLTNGYRENCLAEFKHVVRTLLNKMEHFWPRDLEGFGDIYLWIWGEIWTLCRTFIFHPQNTLLVKDKIELLKQAIQTEAYQTALMEANFSYPQRIRKRLAKEFLRFAMCRRWYKIVYIILKCVSQMMDRSIQEIL